MTEASPNNPSGESVLYADRDYVGLLRRLAILIVDIGVLVFTLVIAVVVSAVIVEMGGNSDAVPMLLWVVFVYVYLAVLKPSRVRTVGYWLTGVRIVNHRGESPSVLRMTFRLMLWGFGPINPLVDFLWLGGDQHRQTLRDKFAGTYVIRRDAKPVAQGKRVAAYYNLMGATFIFWEIKPTGHATNVAS